MQKISPSLWFDNNAEEAMNFYVSVFKNSKIVSIKRYPEGFTEGPLAGMGGKVLNGIFEIEGQSFFCLDGGPIFKFNESVSFLVDVDTQEELDSYWDQLSAVPESEQCGWLKDKFGVSWQIIPKRLGELLNDPDPVKAGRVMDTMLQQHKIIIADLEAAYEGK